MSFNFPNECNNQEEFSRYCQNLEDLVQNDKMTAEIEETSNGQKVVEKPLPNWWSRFISSKSLDQNHKRLGDFICNFLLKNVGEKQFHYKGNLLPLLKEKWIERNQATYFFKAIESPIAERVDLLAGVLQEQEKKELETVDCILVCNGEQELLAHRSRLIQESPFFSTLEQTGFLREEKGGKRVLDLKGFDKNTVQLFLDYTDFNKLPKQIEDLFSLYHIASFLQDDTLIHKCEDALSENFTQKGELLVAFTQEYIALPARIPSLERFLLGKCIAGIEDKKIVHTEAVKELYETIKTIHAQEMGHLNLEPLHKTIAVQHLLTYEPFLAECQLAGVGTEKNEVEGFNRFHSLADFFEPFAGQGFCQFKTASCFEQGIGAEINLKEAVAYYKKGALQGEIRAMLPLARCLFEGKGLDRKDPSEAVLWTMAAAETDDKEAHFLLGEAYQAGNGIAKDNLKAIDHLMIAAETKDPRALTSLGLALKEKGDDDGDLSKKRWIDYVKEAANQNYAHAEFIYADYFTPTAIYIKYKFFERASEHGYADADYALAKVFENPLFAFNRDRSNLERFSRLSIYFSQRALTKPNLSPAARAGAQQIIADYHENGVLPDYSAELEETLAYFKDRYIQGY